MIKMPSPELDVLYSIVNSIDHPAVEKIVDHNGFWLVTLTGCRPLEIHYKIRDGEEHEDTTSCVVNDIPCKVNWVNPEFMANGCECCTREGGMTTHNSPDGQDNYVPYPEMKGESP